MSKKEKFLLKAAIAFALMFAVTPAVNAMHIMEGYLPVKYCIAWGVICVPFLVAGLISLKKRLKENRKTITLIAMAGAFIFVISSLKIPSVTGSCSHMTGTGLGAILFGGSQRTGNHRAFVPGDSAGTRRIDNTGGKHIFHGDSGTASVIWNLSAL